VAGADVSGQLSDLVRCDPMQSDVIISHTISRTVAHIVIANIPVKEPIANMYLCSTVLCLCKPCAGAAWHFVTASRAQ